MLKQKFLNTISKYNMLSRNDKVLVAVSGGPDSVVMLYLLNDLAKELNLRLHLAHLNHMLRPKEADRDMRFVIALARKLNIPITAEKIDAGKFTKKEKLSPEEGARALRYDFFLKTAKKVKAKKVAVAHTQDDQAETVLMRLIRGSGLLGLSAISPLRKMGQCLIIRPMINISRRKIEKFIKKNKLNYCLDSTNAQDIFLRNKIRKQLLPFLKKNYKKSVAQVLSRAAENVALDYEYLNQLGEKVFKKISQFKNKQVALPLKAAKKLHPSLQKYLFGASLVKIKGNLSKIEDKHYNLFLDLIKNNSIKAVDLPGGISLKRNEGKIIFSEQAPSEAKGRSRGRTRLKMPGKTILPGLNLTIQAKLLKKISLSRIKQKKSALVEYFDYRKLKKPLFIRFRRSKDMFQPLGMQGVKSLKEFFIDEKIPRQKRELTPLLTDGKNILWAVGHRLSQKARITPRTAQVVKLTLLKNKLPK